MFPIWIQAEWLKLRTDTQFTAQQLREGETGAGTVPQVDPTVPYASFTTAERLKKFCKIVKSKSFLMKPGTPYRFKIKSQRGYKYPLVPTIDGKGATFKKGNMLLMIKYQGIPLVGQYASTSANDTALSSCVVTSVVKDYISFYNMDDAVDTSIIRNNIPAKIAISEDLLGGNPTLYNWADQRTPLNSVNFVPPNTVKTIAG